MPGPPPPSPSYNLVLDTDSDDSSSVPDTPPTARPVVTTASVESLEATELIEATEPPLPPHVISPQNNTTNNNKKKKKKKNKKKRKKKQAKSVQFGSVKVTEFQRTLGLQVVPDTGGWPLGMEEKLQTTSSTIQEYEDCKVERLRQRCPNSTVFETRQWDYKSSDHKNPLFGKLTEKDRMKLLLRSCDTVPPPPAASPDSPRKQRLRSQSKDFTQWEQFAEPFTQHWVHGVRHDLEVLRNHRDDPVGCTCKPLVVYVPPDPQHVPKKAQGRRLTIAKLKEELHKRHMIWEQSQSRYDMEVRLRDVVADEPCCLYQDCPCTHHGIACQMDTCGCWRSKSCGNPEGLVEIDFDAIQQHRQEQIQDYQLRKEPGMEEQREGTVEAIPV